MSESFSHLINRISEEPPFRILSQKFVKYFIGSLRQKARWEAVERPNYLSGLLKAADQAMSQNIKEIVAIEFGVAAGGGLVSLDKYAGQIEQEVGIGVRLFGFDSGSGLPLLLPDFRDHPDQWRACDYPMAEEKLRKRLSERTDLILGNVKETVPKFLAKNTIPIGFVSFDLDLYSSTVDAMKILSVNPHKNLNRVILYFDDTDFFFNHKFAGELLAISEFNDANENIKIDRWRGIHRDQVFKDRLWLNRMYIAHHLDAISNVQLQRSPSLKASASLN